MAAQISRKKEKRKKMEKSESDEEVEKKQRVMVEEDGDGSMESDDELEVIVTGSWPRQLVVRARDGEDGIGNIPYIRLFRSLEERVGGVVKATLRGERAVLVEVSDEASLRLRGLESLYERAVTVCRSGGRGSSPPGTSSRIPRRIS